MNQQQKSSLKEAFIMIGLMIIIGATIGSLFHYWPLPVNGSKLIIHK